MPDFTNEQAAFNQRAAEIASQLLTPDGQPNLPAAEPVAAVAEVPVDNAPAPSPPVDPPAAEPPYIQKLLARIADLESTVSESRKQSIYQPPTPQEQARPAVDVNQFNTNPLAAMQQLGIDAENVTRQLVANALGKDAPPEVRAQAAVSGQLANMQRELAEAKQALGALNNELRRRDYSNDLQEYASGVDASKFPSVAAALGRDAKRTQQELMRVVIDHARTPGVTAPLTPEQAVAQLEKNLSWLGIAPQPSPGAPTAAPANPANPTVPAAKPPIPSTLSGAPSKLASSELTWEQKTQAILEETKRKFGIA